MTRPGPHLALLLLGSYRKLVDAAVRELADRGHDDVRPSLHYAMSAIDLGAESASELGRALSVSKQAAAKTIAVLVQRGWVAVEDDTADRRRRRLRVTDLGHRVMREGEAIFDDLRKAWAERIGDDELARLEELLTAFVGADTIRLESPGWIAAEQSSIAE
ncbi:MarR family transcriptional regulator [Virgisporangium aliadipatigenens]|uniref:MarR family transcriptional regulator n=1 Tax=Virgisporangium aliadipatigenens TaxID=741659 RepID=A0A8J3YGB7_9ACTN|nr:MarR family winged helix-turn-helix transcriptional regulator [Virgisporangium aliadipatigenens]GIJ43713.1 MarR family transcriptional regulator [Virgisporangium aliadipatigenens]